MRVAIGSDHAGFVLKEYLRDALPGHEFLDLGTFSTSSCDYPSIAQRVAQSVLVGDADTGILVCGTGVGMSMAANKVSGIRAAVCSEPYSARLTRLHNDANILCLGARVVGEGLAEEIVGAWLNTAFSGEDRHQRRIDQVMALEMREP